MTFLYLFCLRLLQMFQAYTKNRFPFAAVYPDESSPPLKQAPKFTLKNNKNNI